MINYSLTNLNHSFKKSFKSIFISVNKVINTLNMKKRRNDKYSYNQNKVSSI